MNVIRASFAATVLLFCVTGQSYATLEEDYCWRDYRGKIPPDAFKAGIDRNENPIYIGQVLHDDKLIPGEIYTGDNNIYFEFAKIFSKNETVKILCTQHPEKFQWISVKWDEVKDLKDKQIFEGGYEKGFYTYVGRAKEHGEIGIGKVICWTDDCYRLTTIHEGNWEDHDEYELLVYEPDDNKVGSTIILEA